jgi:hypothetical protein
MSRPTSPLELELAPLNHPIAIPVELQDERLRGPSANFVFASIVLLVALAGIVLHNNPALLSPTVAASISFVAISGAVYGMFRAEQERGVEGRNRALQEGRDRIVRDSPELNIKNAAFVTHLFSESSVISLTTESLVESLREGISTDQFVSVLNNIFTDKPLDQSLLKSGSAGRIEEANKLLHVIDLADFGRTENRQVIQFIFNSCLLSSLKHHPELLPEVNRDELTEKYKTFRTNFLQGCYDNYPETVVERSVDKLLIPLCSAFIAEGKIDDVTRALNKYHDGHLEVPAAERPAAGVATPRSERAHSPAGSDIDAPGRD